ncbi:MULTISPECIES: hypothetical protein [Bacillus]|uniref:hypothetical protein n=1 Tax=Bacillus TaxID=1386 RepID=UPI000FE2AD48|nr:hypothetical protein EKA14_26880 [Bacillus mycoides]
MGLRVTRKSSAGLKCEGCSKLTSFPRTAPVRDSRQFPNGEVVHGHSVGYVCRSCGYRKKYFY